MPVCKKTPLEGELDSAHANFDIPDILLSVCETKGTGLLTFSTTEAEKTLFVREGSYIFAKSSSMDDRLGESLLRSQGQVLIFLSNLRMAPRVRVYAADSFDVSCGRSSFRSSSTFLAVKTSILTPRHLFATAKRTAKESFIAASSVKK